MLALHAGPSEKSKFWAIAISFCLAAIVVQAAATALGIGIEGDSFAYLKAAKHVAEGYSLLTIPIVKWPPLYPILIGSISSAADADPLVVARYFYTGLFAVSTLLLAWILHGITRSLAAMSLGLVLWLTAAPILKSYSVFMTEGLYMVLSLLALVMLIRHLENARWGTLILSAVLMAAAILTRFVGVSLVCAAIVVLLLQQRPMSATAKRIAVLVAFSGFPVILLIFRNAFYFPSVIERELHFLMPTWHGQFRFLFAGISQWVTPDIFSVTGRAVLAAVVYGILLCLAFLWLRSRRFPGGHVSHGPMVTNFLSVLLIYGLCYGVFYALSMMFIGNRITFDVRNQAPLYPLALIFIVVWGHRLSVTRCTGTGLRRSLYAAGVLVPVMAGAATVQFVYESAVEGIGYNNQAWRQHPMVTAVARLPDGAVIYSNVWDVLALHLRRRVKELPQRGHVDIWGERPDFKQRLARMQKELAANNGYLAFIAKKGYRPEYATLDLWKKLLPLSVEWWGEEGQLLRYVPKRKAQLK